MAIEATAAAREIMASVRAVQATQPASAAAAAAAVIPTVNTNDFCTVWPQARPILQMLVSIVAFIPGLGSVAAGVLQGLLRIGDMLSAELCQR